MTEVNANTESAETNEKVAEEEKAADASPKASELPTEVRTKLRKLEKLELKYQGTLARD
jgi:hypothetical protein